MASEIQASVPSTSEQVSEKTSDPSPAVQPTTADQTVTNPTDTVTTTTSTPLQELASHLSALLSSTGHSEVWGVELTDPSTSVPTQIILQKYLNANDQDVGRAKEQLEKTLEWRAKMNPLDMLKAKHSREKFGGLGFVTVYETEGDGEEKSNKDPEKREVFTWNVYGATRSINDTFADLPTFLAWRVALMELAIARLSLSTATQPISATFDPYKITQVHDYMSISFFRQPASVRAASKTTIEVFAQNYPELLKEKFFVNVPVVMGFFYEIIKRFVAETTRRRFHPMRDGAGLAAEFDGQAAAAGKKKSKVPALGTKLPTAYGGKGATLDEVGVQVELE